MFGSDVVADQARISRTASTVAADTGPFDLGTAAVTDDSQVTGHTYTVTVAGANVTITDATNGRVLLDTAAFAQLADPFLGIPGLSLPLNGAIGVSGAPGGNIDEACAREALAKIQDRIK